MASLLDWALRYAGMNWPVLPLHTWTGVACTCGVGDCTSPAKHPRTRNGLKDASVDPVKIRSWWGRWPDANIGLRTGEAFDVLDVDGDQGFESVTSLENEHGAAESGPSSETGGGGLHRLYQPTGLGNRAGLLNHVDWRGKGGYIVAPPSLHASGQRYEWSAELGYDAPIRPVDGWLKGLLFPPAPPRPSGSLTTSQRGDSGKYARKALDAEVGELLRTAVGGRNDQLNQAAFNMYQLAAGGEISETEVTDVLTTAARAIGLGQREIEQTLSSARHAGAAQPRTAPALSLVHGNTARKPEPQSILSLEQTEEKELTGWEPEDIATLLAGDLTIPPPVHFARTDGTCLLYAGKIHAFNGEPESGKSWAAQYAVVQAITAGQDVTYLDFEDSPQSVLGRLLALGASPVDITTHFTYIQPDRPLSDEAKTLLREHFRTHRPLLAVIDGVTEAMSTLGLEPLDNADTAHFFRVLPRPLAKLGAAVVLVDHVVKDSEDRGRWAIGAQHKMAALTGAAFTIDIVKPFGRNMSGFAKMTVTKDRPGYIREHARGSLVAELHIISAEDGSVTAKLKPPVQAEDGFRPTGVMEIMSKRLEGRTAMPGPDLFALVKRRKDDMLAARRWLVDEGYVLAHKNGNSTYYSSVKPYRSDQDPKLIEEIADEAF